MDFPDIPGYQIQEEIGRGSMGVVYRARHIALDRVVALKVLNPRYSSDEQFVKSFSQEAKTIARLSHPNIVLVHDFGHTEDPEGVYYLTMQFVHGRTVRDLMEVRRPTPLESAQIIRQIADALDYAHRHEVIHRDVKPGNIMLCPDGKAMIMDFGVASGYYAGSEGHVWIAAGSPTYMSPEQCKGLKASPRSDQYSLGITLYEMVSGKPPFTARDPNAAKQQQISEAPPPLRLGRTDISPRMEAAVFRAISKLPEMRFVTVNDFADEFERACQEKPADDILVGTAPGADQPVPTAASLVGGESFAAASRSTSSGVYVSAIRSAGEGRRRRSLALVLLLLVLCGGAAAAAYFTYFRPPSAPAVTKKKTTKSSKGRRSGSGSRRTSGSGGTPSVSIDHSPGAATGPDSSSGEGEKSSSEEEATSSEHSGESEETPAPEHSGESGSEKTDDKGSGDSGTQ